MTASHRQTWTWVLLAAVPLCAASGLRAGEAPGHDHECTQACAPVCKKCVPVPGVRKESQVVYACKESALCLPHRSLWDLFCGHADPCATCGGCGGCHPCPAETCPQCECRPRRKMVLMKKIVTVECPTYKCEAVCVPAPCNMPATVCPAEAVAPPSAWLSNPRAGR